MKRDEKVYLQHILDAIQRLEEYLSDVDEQKFNQQYLIQDGVIRQLEIIGEAVKHLPTDFRARYPEIPWQDIAGTRDKLIHQYFGVDIETVWLMTQEDIPMLKSSVRNVMADL